MYIIDLIIGTDIYRCVFLCNVVVFRVTLEESKGQVSGPKQEALVESHGQPSDNTWNLIGWGLTVMSSYRL